jgi:hypothetical protein
MKARFDAAVKLDPDQRGAHDYYLRKLCKKWSGSHEEMFAFAREVASKADEGSRLHGLIALAHVERWLYDSSFENKGAAADVYWKDPAVASEVMQAFQRSAGSPRWSAKMNDALAHNYLAYALAATGATSIAMRELERLGERVTEFPWCYHGDSRAVAKRVRETGALRG